MVELTDLQAALAAIANDLDEARARFALVGGLAVSVRADVRFTRDVDVAVAVDSDREAEALVHGLISRGYRSVALVEHETVKRLATVRLLSPKGVKVDLLFASSGIEREVVERASPVSISPGNCIPVARAEELTALKVLSMTERRLQDLLDAQNLFRHIPDLNLAEVRQNLRLIGERGFHRNQDLDAKLERVIASK